MPKQTTTLIVEDDPVFRRVMCYTIKKAGMVVESCSNGDLAYTRLMQGGIDFLVTDLQMPICDGLTLLQRLADTPDYVRPPAILCTAKGLELESERLINQFQLCEIMHKPFSPRHLIDMITKHTHDEAVA